MSLLENENLNKFLESGAVISFNPSDWLVAWGEITESAEHHSGDFRFYVSEFLDEYGKWKNFSNYELINKSLFLKILENAKKQHLLHSIKSHQRNWQEPEASEFEMYFREFQKDSLKLQLDKIVPVVFSISQKTLNPLEKIEILKKLTALPQGLYAYGFWNSNYGFLGATPELLLQKTGKKFVTMALAGTGRLDTPSLLENSKEIKEHQYVIQDIQQKLKGCRLDWKNTEEWKIGNLKHLRTYVNGESDYSLQELIKTLHPTAALGGAPGKMSLDVLKKYCDPTIRKFFGAPFGAKIKETEIILVALRGIQWFGDNCYMGSGCGLVKESSLEKEWAELKLKRDFTRGFLNI